VRQRDFKSNVNELSRGRQSCTNEATSLNLSAGKTHFSNVTVDLVFKSYAPSQSIFLWALTCRGIHYNSSIARCVFLSLSMTLLSVSLDYSISSLFQVPFGRASFVLSRCCCARLTKFNLLICPDWQAQKKNVCAPLECWSSGESFASN
jgi:hypothetical protein